MAAVLVLEVDYKRNSTPLVQQPSRAEHLSHRYTHTYSQTIKRLLELITILFRFVYKKREIQTVPPNVLERTLVFNVFDHLFCVNHVADNVEQLTFYFLGFILEQKEIH